MIFMFERGYKEILFSYTWVKTNWNVTDGQKKKKKQTAGSWEAPGIRFYAVISN